MLAATGLTTGAKPLRRALVGELLLLAEGVEKVRTLNIFETMFQNLGFRRINIAESAAHSNDSCTKSVGSDFFNTLGYKQTSSRPKSKSALPPRADIPRPTLDFRF